MPLCLKFELQGFSSTATQISMTTTGLTIRCQPQQPQLHNPRTSSPTQSINQSINQSIGLLKNGSQVAG